MKSLIEKIKLIDLNKLDYSYLFDYILPFESDNIDFESILPPIENKRAYARNILLLEPIELVLINWPPAVESAIHLHQGFWGYVGVLKGQALNTEYHLEKKLLKEIRSVVINKNGIIPEPDGTIHKISNASDTENLVTLHFYYPALKDLNGLKIFSEDGSIVELNEKAGSASLDLNKDCYRSYLKDQFDFDGGERGRSHLISPIVPKPSNAEIKEMIQAYYSAQAQNYDLHDEGNENRITYVRAVNQILIEEFQKYKPKGVLAIASGTGRRAANIKKQSGLDYVLYGQDVNEEMCQQSKERGLIAFCADWLDLKIDNNALDVITMLYSFGHISGAEERILFLEKIHQKLKSGGCFYFDVFNIDDPYEWGANALNIFKKYNLDYFHYEKGDVFYRRSGMKELAFLHYFEKERLVALLESIGFKVDWVKNIGYMKDSGLIRENNEGKLFLKAVKE